MPARRHHDHTVASVALSYSARRLTAERWLAYTNPLEQLLVATGYAQYAGGGAPDTPIFADQDQLEALDATWEDANGRLPHQPGYDPGFFESKPDTIVIVPDTIPAWVLADAREMAAGGMTVQRIATAILPVTGCPDIPACEQLLAQLLG